MAWEHSHNIFGRLCPLPQAHCNSDSGIAISITTPGTLLVYGIGRRPTERFPLILAERLRVARRSLRQAASFYGRLAAGHPLLVRRAGRIHSRPGLRAQDKLP